MSQDSPLEATTNATGKGTPALIFLNYCYTFFYISNQVAKRLTLEMAKS